MATLKQQLVAARQENTELRALLARADADCEAKLKVARGYVVGLMKQRNEYKCAYEALRRQQRLAFCRTNNVSAGDSHAH